MPFHPTCFEVFSHASRLRNQRIDLQGLAGWREFESNYYSSFPHSISVRKAADQQWIHAAGDEWLAANPVVVPLLPSLLRSTIHGLGEPLDDKSPSINDPFTSLPQEICDIILNLLCPTDVASLRLALCATHLPIAYWRGILQEEMPWLWEVWDDAEPSFWATTSVSAILLAKKRRETAETLLSEQRTIIQEEIPEIYEAWCRDHALRDEDYCVEKQPYTIQLPPDRTNWCRLYYEIKTHWEELKGLQNRQRIWTDVVKILERIQKYRDEGKLPS